MNCPAPQTLLSLLIAMLVASIAHAGLPERCGARAPLPEGVSAHVFDSKTMGRPVCYLAVRTLAKGEQQLRAPSILVLLHGLGATPGEWIKQGKVSRRLAEVARSRKLPSTVTIIPFGERGYWTNWPDGGAAWADVVVRDVLPDARQRFKARTGPKHTAIAGLSMGGFGALSIGLQHPQEFGFIAALSPTDVELAVHARPTNPDYMNAFGSPPARDRVRAVNPYRLARKGLGKNQQILLSYGDKEPAKFSEGTERLAGMLRKRGQKVRIRVVEGGTHGWKTNWRPRLQRWWLGRLARHWAKARKDGG